MLDILFILAGIIVAFFLVIFVSIYRDYRVNKKLDKKSRKKRLSRRDAKALRERLHNMGKPPWVRNFNRNTDDKKKK